MWISYNNSPDLSLKFTWFLMLWWIPFVLIIVICCWIKASHGDVAYICKYSWKLSAWRERLSKTVGARAQFGTRQWVKWEFQLKLVVFKIGDFENYFKINSLHEEFKDLLECCWKNVYFMCALLHIARVCLCGTTTSDFSRSVPQLSMSAFNNMKNVS